jgi:hypothetical protein
MRQHHCSRRVRPVVRRPEQAAGDGMESHHFEVRPADDTGADDARLAKADHRELDHREVTERRQRLHARLQVVDFRDGEVRVFDPGARSALPDVDQPVLVTVDQRPQQDATDDAEDGGVGADAERERDDDGGAQSLGAAERTQCEAEIAREVRGAHDG